MGKLKFLSLPILLSLLLIPLSTSFAQQDEPLQYGTTQDESVIYESGPVVEEPPVLYNEEDGSGFVRDDIDKYDTDTYLSDEATAFLQSMSIGFTVFFITMFIAGYVFFAVALSKIGKELGYENPWFAWVPLLNYIMVFQLGEQNPLLLLLLLIPGIGVLVIMILAIVALMKITQKRGYDEALALILFTGIGAYVLFYLLAWKPITTQSQADLMATKP